MRNISNKMEIIENIVSQESKDLFTTYHELSNQQAYFYTRSKATRRGLRGPFLRPRGESLPPTCVNTGHKTSKLVRQVSIGSSFKKNYRHGNDRTFGGRLREENTEASSRKKTL